SFGEVYLSPSAHSPCCVPKVAAVSPINFIPSCAFYKVGSIVSCTRRLLLAQWSSEPGSLAEYPSANPEAEKLRGLLDWLGDRRCGGMRSFELLPAMMTLIPGAELFPRCPATRHPPVAHWPPQHCG